MEFFDLPVGFPEIKTPARLARQAHVCAAQRQAINSIYDAHAVWIKRVSPPRRSRPCSSSKPLRNPCQCVPGTKVPGSQYLLSWRLSDENFVLVPFVFAVVEVGAELPYRPPILCHKASRHLADNVLPLHLLRNNYTPIAVRAYDKKLYFRG